MSANNETLAPHLQEEVRSTLELIEIKEHPERTVEAFHVVTDAQAQRRNLTNNVIIRDPILIAGVCGLGALIVYHVRNRSAGGPMDWGMLLMSLGGFLIAIFSVVNKYTEEVVAIAERMDIDEIFAPDVAAYSFVYKDMIVGTVGIKSPPDYKPGVEATAAALKKTEETLKKMDAETKTQYDQDRETRVKVFHKQKDGVALLTAWTALRRYRGIGLGQDMLDKAVDVATNTYHAKALVALCESTEKPAIAVLKKNGFVLVDKKMTRGQRGKWFQIMEYTWMKKLGTADETKIKSKSEES